jgi:pilus assembly protein FimV
MKKNNVRYLTSTLVAASLLGSAPSYALGIGEMKLKSALNQNLQAEISLLLSEGENASDIKVNLAPNAKFDEAGIPWTIFLSKIKFEVINQNGKTFIKLSSKEVLKEPFLDFLIEVRNAKSSLYREFTVLVDPPAAYGKPANEPIAPVAKSTVEKGLPLRFVDAPATPINFEASTHTIQESDTLWRIASQFNQQNNVSVHRMIAAILIANPDAFQKDKAHTMIVGKTLKIPSFVETPHLFKPTQTAKMPAKKAVVAVKKVARVKNSNPLAKTKSAQPPVEVSKEDKQKEIANEKQAEKTISDESQKRIAEMEQQLAQMKKMVAEKDAEMAKLKTVETTTPSIVEKASDKPLGETSAPIAISQPAPIVAPVTTQLENTVSVLPPTLTLPEPAVQAVMPVQPGVEPSVPVAPASVKPVVTMPPVVLPQEIKTESFFGIPGDLYYYVAGGVGSLLLSVLGWLRLREKKKMQAVETEIKSIVDEVPDEKIESVFAENNMEVTDNANNVAFEELEMNNSLFEEASHEFADMISHDIDRHDVDDVLYKVDVYCSYGNFEHAETLLRDEFTKNTNAHDYALRLLKLYQDQENTDGFKEFVFELAELGKRNVPDFWAVVVEKSQAFYPEALFFMPQETTTTALNLEKNEPNFTPNFDALFADDPDEKEITFGELSEQETLSASSVDDMFAAPFDVSAFGTDKKEPEVTLGGFTLDDMFKTEPVALESTAAETVQMLDFGDFETLETQEFKTTVTKNVAVPPDLELEFNFGDFVVPEKEIVTPEKVEEVKIDLDFGEFKLDETPVIETKKALEEPALEFNFADFAMAESVESPAIEDAKIDLDFGEFKLDETPVIETKKALEEPALEFNFADFATAESVESPAIEEAKVDLDFGEFKLDETPVIETKKALEEPALEFNFADFAMADSVESPAIEEAKVDLDFGEFKLDETPVIETKKAPEEPALEFNFADFATADSVESPAIEDAKIDLDFGEFKLDETPVIETKKALEEPALEFNFADFATADSVESPAIEEAKVDLDFGEFKLDETPVIETKKTVEEPALEFNTTDFVAPEITELEAIQPVTLEKTTFGFSEFVSGQEIPFAEPEKVTFKPQIDFATVSEIVEKRIQQAYSELEKVTSKEELDLSYLEMSDAQFAQAIADEVLKKCQIKEQLCRQKITLEVLTKLS